MPQRLLRRRGLGEGRTDLVERVGRRGARGRLPCLRHGPRPLARRRALASPARRSRRDDRPVGLSALVPPPDQEGRRTRRRALSEGGDPRRAHAHRAALVGRRVDRPRRVRGVVSSRRPASVEARVARDTRRPAVARRSDAAQGDRRERGARGASGGLRREAQMIAQLNGQIGLAYAFVEREIALSKRYWAWEIVWLVYGIVTALSVAYIGLAAPAISGNQVDEAAVSRVLHYLLVGTIAWRFLGIIFENIGEVIAWERWEGTIEYTFMSPVPRLTHLLGMCAATLVRALAFSIGILACVTLFVPVDLSHAN